MEDDLEIACTPDNTKVMRIMGGFNEFLSTQRKVSAAQNSRTYLSSIPFNLPKDDETSLNSKDVVQTHLTNTEMMIRLKNMEAGLASSEKLHLKANIALEAKIEKLNSENMHLKEKHDNLQLKVKHLTTQALELIDEVTLAKKEKNDEINKWESLYNEREKLNLKNDENLTNDLNAQVMKNKQLQEENLQLKYQINMFNLRMEEMSSQMEHLKNRASEVSCFEQVYHQTEEKLLLAEKQVHDLTMRLSDAEDTERMAKIFKEELSHLKQLETTCKRLMDENKKLMENQENGHILNEKLISMESKLQRAEVRSSKMNELESAVETLTAQLQLAKTNTVDNTAFNNLQTQLSQSQHLFNVLEEKDRTLETEYKILNTKYAEVKEEKTKVEMKLAEHEEKFTSVSAQLLRLRKRAGLLAHERDSLRSILLSYDAELTMTSHTTQLSKRLENEVAANERLHKRIQQLEEELKKAEEINVLHKVHGKQLEVGTSSEFTQESGLIKLQEPTAMESDGAVNLPMVAEMKEKIEQQEKDRTALLEKIENLEAWLEQSKMKGDYNLENTKVLHFAMNPAALAHQRSLQGLADLKSENLKLKQKITELQEGHEVSMSEIEISKSAKEEIARAELRNQRLKEIFNKKIQEFRQACHTLFGFRIDTVDSKYKLLSTYAESEADYLVFQMKPGGDMELLETEFSTTLGELISLHLHHQNSIPMFLSALSVNLFSQQTIISVY